MKRYEIIFTVLNDSNIFRTNSDWIMPSLLSASSVCICCHSLDGVHKRDEHFTSNIYNYLRKQSNPHFALWLKLAKSSYVHWEIKSRFKIHKWRTHKISLNFLHWEQPPSSQSWNICEALCENVFVLHGTSKLCSLEALKRTHVPTRSSLICFVEI